MLTRLQEIARTAGKADTQAVLAFAEILSEIHSRKAALAAKWNLKRKGHCREVAVFIKNQQYHPFEDNDDWLALIVRETSERLIGGKRQADAINAAMAITIANLHPFEKKAFDIVRGKARGRTPSNNLAGRDLRRAPAAVRIASAIRRDWLRRSRKLPQPAAERLTGKDVVLTALPILDELAGAPIRGGDPTETCANGSWDLYKMNPPGLAVLYCLAKESAARIKPREISGYIRAIRQSANLNS